MVREVCGISSSYGGMVPLPTSYSVLILFDIKNLDWGKCLANIFLSMFFFEFPI